VNHTEELANIRANVQNLVARGDLATGILCTTGLKYL